MEDNDKLHARSLREREKHRNESLEQRASRLQVSHLHGLSVPWNLSLNIELNLCVLAVYL